MIQGARQTRRDLELTGQTIPRWHSQHGMTGRLFTASFDLPEEDSMAFKRTPVAAHDLVRSSQRPHQPIRWLAGTYFLLSGVGLTGTWYYNIQFSGGNYLQAWFANAASSSAAIDLIVLAIVVGLFYLREGRRLGWRWYMIVLFLPLSVGLALAFAFPLFLGLREIQLARIRTQVVTA